MQEKIIDSMSDINLSASDLITLMFERTDEDGILYIPAFNETDDSYRCNVDWNLYKYEKLLDKFKRHYNSIMRIAVLYDDLDGTVENAQTVLDDELFEFWNIYIRPFDIGDIDYDRVLDICDRLDTIQLVKNIAEDFAKGQKLEDRDRQFLSSYIDIEVSQEEELYRKKYVNAVYLDAENRVGNNICAYDVVVYSMRLCRLMSLDAPETIINNEAHALAAAMLLHDYGISRECVDSSVRLYLERLEMMSEEELDELYRPKKVNSRKSLAPLFVYEILHKKSNSKKHLRQQDILKELERYPYEITLERKALSRIIHNLIDSQYHIYSDKTGVWVEQEKKG